MRVFISWSGARSGWVADALHEWLPCVVQDAEPFLSRADIDAGARWVQILSEELSQTQFGIPCVTPENMNAPWLLFEAGAVSKALDTARVCVYLLEMDHTQLQGPFAQFQSSHMTQEGTWNIVKSVNKALGSKITEPRLKAVFDSMFPKLNEKLHSIPPVGAEAPPKRTSDSMIEEILERVRGLERGRNLAVLEQQILKRLSSFVSKARGAPDNVPEVSSQHLLWDYYLSLPSNLPDESDSLS